MVSSAVHALAHGMKRRPRLPIVLLTIAFVVTPALCLVFGAAGVSLQDIGHVLAYHFPGTNLQEPPRIAEAIIWLNRAPRIVAGIAVGAILAVSGTILQALTRNALAEPYILGVSAGAATGNAVAIVLLGLTSGLGRASLSFLGATGAAILVLGIGGRRGRSILQLVLAGLAIGFIFQSITNLVILSSDNAETARSVMFWMLGSLAHAQWEYSWVLLVCAALLTACFWLLAPLLDAIASGDASALSVGINPAALRAAMTLVVSIVVGLAVSATGGIGFVGLVVPHLCRTPFGHEHRRLVPAVALSGSVFLVLADTFARVTFAPAEIPIGVMTGLVGAPILLFMIRRMASPL